MVQRYGRQIDPLKFRELVAAKLWSLTELARNADVSERSVTNAAAGRRVNLATAKALALALGCEVDEFSTLTGPAAPALT